MPGSAAQRPAEVARPDLDGVGQAHELVVERVEDAARALLLVDGEVGAGDVADEQRVAGQDRPRLVAARGVDERERGVLGAVAGRVQRADLQRAEFEFPAVVERLVVVVGLGVAVDVDGRAGGGDEPAVAGDVVGVVVGLQDVLDAHAEVAREAQVLVDVELRVDDGGDAGVLVADEVAGAAEVVVGELAEDHRVLPGVVVSRFCCSQAVMPPETLWASRPARRAAVGGHRRAAAALADEGDGAVGRQLAEALLELAERQVPRAGREASRPLGVLADVDEDQAAGLVSGQGLDDVHRVLALERASPSRVAEADVGQDAVQRLGQPPRPLAEQPQRDRDEQQADQGGVEQDGDAEDDAHLLRRQRAATARR